MFVPPDHMVLVQGCFWSGSNISRMHESLERKPAHANMDVCIREPFGPYIDRFPRSTYDTYA